LVVHRRALLGPTAIAGVWGHHPLPGAEPDERPGPPCYCGLHGCIETWLSGPGLAADHARRGGTGDLDAAAIAARAAEGEPLAAAALGAWTRRLAQALASVINIVDPDVIVLGGGLSRIESTYRDVPALWPTWVFSDTVRTVLRPARFGDASGVRGAAWLWPSSRA
jgi:predicted NBD/HSP70 family sugar kinase